jgi:hypothetical protein
MSNYQAEIPDVGGLLQTWIGIHLDTIDSLMAEAHEKVEALPDMRVLWSLYGELLLGLRALEAEVAELRKAVRR